MSRQALKFLPKLFNLIEIYSYELDAVCLLLEARLWIEYAIVSNKNIAADYQNQL